MIEKAVLATAGISTGALFYVGANAVQDFRGQSNVLHLDHCVNLDAASNWDAKSFDKDCADLEPASSVVSGPSSINKLGGHDLLFTESLPSPQKLNDDNFSTVEDRDNLNKLLTSSAAGLVVAFTIIGGVSWGRSRSVNASDKPAKQDRVTSGNI